MDTSILLDSGTNEFEILEFTAGGQSFGINAAKVRELIRRVEVRPVPNSHPCVEGVLTKRDTVFTVVDLAAYLGLDKDISEKSIFLVAELNQTVAAFDVDSVHSIHRVSWTSIEKPDDSIFGSDDGIVTGICKMPDGNLLLILDFEKILFELNGNSEYSLESLSEMEARPRIYKTILIAEDSAFLRRTLMQVLVTAGYTNIITTSNGAEAWEFLETKKTGGDIQREISCVITDIEMPRLNGLNLTRRIKADPVLKELPVIIFSSLIDESMSIKCTEVGADAQLSKPEVNKLISYLDDVLNVYSENNQEL